MDRHRTGSENDVDPIDALVSEFMQRSAGVLRGLLAERRAELMKTPPPARCVVRASREDLEAAEHVDELTRERARSILDRRTAKGRARR